MTDDYTIQVNDEQEREEIRDMLVAIGERPSLYDTEAKRRLVGADIVVGGRESGVRGDQRQSTQADKGRRRESVTSPICWILGHKERDGKAGRWFVECRRIGCNWRVYENE